MEAESVDQTLHQLGQELISGDPAQTVAGASAESYCSFCWARMAPGAQECPDCGETLSAMHAVEAARAERDRDWVPPSRRAASEPLPGLSLDLEPPVETVEAAAPAPQVQRPGRKPKPRREPRPRRAAVPGEKPWLPFAVALGVGGVIGLVGGSAVWFMLSIFAAVH